MRKRGAIFGMALMTAALTLSGCTQKAQPEDYHIFTGDPDALKIFVRSSSTYADRLTEQFPDIKFDFYYYDGLNATMAMNQLMTRDAFGDVCITSLQLTDEMAKEHLMDLSANPVCGRYEPSILSQFDIDGSIYQLPGYVVMRNIVYNQDMFETYGWEEPETFGELVDLCRRIRNDTDHVTPIVMGGAANGYYFTTITTYAQAEFLYTPEGQKWCKAFREGKAKAQDGFGKGIAMTQELIDAGAFDYDANFGLWDGDLFRKRMLTEEAVMMFAWGGQTEILKEMEQNPQIRFKLMPFRNQAGQAFIGTNIPYYIGLSKNLAEQGNERKLEQAFRILDWMSTEEGILALSEETDSAVFPIKKVKNKNANRMCAEFWDEHLDSIKAPMLYAGYEDIIVPTAAVIVDSIRGKGRLDHLAEYMDEIRAKCLAGGVDAIKAGSFATDFTHAETVQFFAHILQRKGDSDIALVSDGTYQNGVLNKGGVYLHFFEGGVLEDHMTIHLAGTNAYNQAVQMTLTGKQVRDLLENGKHGVLVRGEHNMRRMEANPEAIAEASFDYYWAGMDVKWKKGKVSSICFDDGRNLGEEDTCTVTFAYEDYTIELEEAGRPTRLPYTTLEVYEEYLREFSPVSPVPVLR